jgi:DNA helicase-2/ATP-dependent DNA helicase PcrA
MISPAYISKGLEFDAVICYNDLEDEFEEKDKYLYYVGITRAQHDLTIYNEPKKIKRIGEK